MEPKKHPTKDYAKFILPSVVGVLLFMVPVQVDGTWTVVVKVVADAIGAALADLLPILCCLVITVSAVLALIGYFSGWKWLELVGLVASVLGASLAILIYAKRVEGSLK